MDFRTLEETRRRELVAALRGNADDGATILIDRRDTSFAGASEDIPHEEVIHCIRAIPCHYGRAPRIPG